MSVITSQRGVNALYSVRVRLIASLLVVITAAFYLAASLLLSKVGSALMEDGVRNYASSIAQASVTLEARRSAEKADVFHETLVEAARQLGGRLLLVDEKGKVTFDSFDQLPGHLLPLQELATVLSGERTTDYGFHRQPEQNRIPMLESGELHWEGCFVSAMANNEGLRTGALVLVVSVENTVRSLEDLRQEILTIFITATVIVLALAAMLSGWLMRPLAELSKGIDRMSHGDYTHPVRVKGKGEMAELAAAFNEMSEQVHRLDEMRNQFVSNASHELRTPLATMKILVESILYQENMESEMRQEFLTDINKEIDRLSSVVSDLLTLVHIDSKKLTLHRETIMFSDTIEETVARIRPLAEKKKQSLTVQINDECEMTGDPGKLSQVVYNLLSNAVKYTQEGGKIGVTLHRDGREAVMEVRDNGIGIAEEDIQHIFERFYRADKSRKHTEGEGGTGLGLSIVLQIVRLHAGSVTVQSKLGQGTVFTVLLPCERK